jgi:hypothetical protein
MDAQASNPAESPMARDSSVSIGADPVRYGWTLFAGIMLGFIGIWDSFEGIFAVVRSSYFVGHAVYGDLWVWALAWLLFGLLEVGAAAALLSGQAWARWFGIIVVGLSALVTMLSIGTNPFWSLVALAVQFGVLYGLTVRWAPPPNSY